MPKTFAKKVFFFWMLWFRIQLANGLLLISLLFLQIQIFYNTFIIMTNGIYYPATECTKYKLFSYNNTIYFKLHRHCLNSSWKVNLYPVPTLFYRQFRLHSSFMFHFLGKVNITKRIWNGWISKPSQFFISLLLL